MPRDPRSTTTMTLADRYTQIHQADEDAIGRFLDKKDGTPRSHHNRRNRRSATPVFSLLPSILLVTIAALAICFMAILGVVSNWIADTPSLSSIESYAATGITNIYASDKKTVLARIKMSNRIEVKSDEISQFVKDATIATEDVRFYEHEGVDIAGIARAAVATFQGDQQGASTITQQLIRNTVLLNEMNDISIKRKIREMKLAIELESNHSKDEILTMYLNIVNYGDGNYGIEAASQDYFDVSADKLTLSQASLLAGVPQSPTYYNLRENYDAAIERRVIILDHMLQHGFITQEQYDEAIADRPAIVPAGQSEDDIKDIAPYFVDYIRELLESGEIVPTRLYQTTGMEIYTTLDVDCQKSANDAVAGTMEYFDSMDAALVSVEPDNGNIVAMVGGRNYKKDKFNLATQMSRQAGSSFKPFVLLAALQAGVPPTGLYMESGGPITIDNWTVDNSDGEGGGKMTLTDATAYSINTIYAKVTHEIGPATVAETANACGIKSPLDTVDSICLGTQGINPLEMASAYATIATGGIRHDPVAITEITDASGRQLYKHEYDDGERVISKSVAQEATKVMSTVLTKGTGTGARLANGQDAAGKTGTSENGRDMWFVGFTPQYSTAVWTGYRDDRETFLYGSTTSTPIWKNYMDGALAGKETKGFKGGAKAPEYTYDWNLS